MTERNDRCRKKLLECNIEPKEDIINKANVLYEKIKEKLFDAKSDEKKVIAIYGGSGVGKSSIAAALGILMEEKGKKSFILHGDNYPLRIPEYNDAERLAIFREQGIRRLLLEQKYDDEIADKLQELQRKEMDTDIDKTQQYSWLSTYIEGGKSGLKNYLGTSCELDYQAVNQVIEEFQAHRNFLWTRKMGRKAYEISYEKIDVSKTDILILEWTHAYSDKIKNRDIQVFLKGNPEETLKNRMERNRDANAASPFISIVLEIEQSKIDEYGKNADIILTKEGKII